MATQRRRNRQAVSQKKIFGGSKLSSSNDKMTEAKRQTKADKADYKKNRAVGDKEMAGRAFDSRGDVKHGFGNDKQLKNGKTLETMEKFGKKGSNIYGNGGGRGIETPSKIPNQVTKKTPPAVQDRQKEVEGLKKMEGIDELKKKGKKA